MNLPRFLAFITALALLIAPFAAHAQVNGRIPTIGVLWHAANAEEEGPLFKGLLEGFRSLGYVEGRNIRLEHRFPNEMPERFKRMAIELVALNVDVLVSAGTQAALALRDATKTIPIVFMFIPDPVGTKLVDSLGRPGGNVTGLSNFSSDLIGKRFQFLKEAMPRLSRVALLVNPDSQISRRYMEAAQAAAPALGFAIKTFEAGALMSYGPDNIAATHRAAAFVDRILKGAKPSELPVEQPTKVQYFINLKIAKALGLTIPPSLLGRADEVIR